MKIRTLLVDDEELAHRAMQVLLKNFEDIKVIGECYDGEEALIKIKKLQPDLIFLDIHMPNLNGMTLLNILNKNQSPLIVFVTAHDDFAVEAFDTLAIDYLLKPVRPARLTRTIDKVKNLLKNKSLSKPLPQSSGKPITRKKLLAKSKGKITPINIHEITSIESAGNYVVVQTEDGSHILRETLTSLEKELPHNEFARINRSMIVKLSQIKELVVANPGQNEILLKDGRTSILTMKLREIEKLLQFTKE